MAVLRIGVEFMCRELICLLLQKQKIYVCVWSKFIYCRTYFEFCYKSCKNIRLLVSVSASKKSKELLLQLEVLTNLK